MSLCVSMTASSGVFPLAVVIFTNRSAPFMVCFPCSSLFRSLAFRNAITSLKSGFIDSYLLRFSIVSMIIIIRFNILICELLDYIILLIQLTVAMEIGSTGGHLTITVLLYETAITVIVYISTFKPLPVYAPLFAHIEGWQWRPDLIWYDNVRMFKSCSYYVQQLYAMNKGTNVLPTTMNGKFVAGQDGQDGLFASSVFDKNSKTVIVKVINTADKDQNVSINLKGVKEGKNVQTITFTSKDMDAENTLDTPEKIVPTDGKAISTIVKNGAVINDDLPAKTFRIYRIQK